MVEKKTPLVSFFIPCYNYGRFLKDCLESIYAQTLKVDFDVLVIDDASQDETKLVIENYLSYPNFQAIFHKENKGHVDTINEGLAQMTGAYLVRIDADDFLRPDFLEKTLPLFSKHLNLGAIFGDVFLTDETSIPGTLCESLPNQHSFFIENPLPSLLKKNYIPAPSFIAKKEAWAHALPIPKGYHHSDWFLSLKMAEKFSFYYLKEALSCYRVHSANHHSKIIATKGEELTRLVILDSYFKGPNRKESLSPFFQTIYSTHYLELAKHYYSALMLEESRRCYKEIFFLNPKALIERKNLKYFLLSFFPTSMLIALKKLSGFLKTH